MHHLLYLNITEQVGQKEVSLEWAPIADRFATTNFWNDLLKGESITVFLC